MAFEKDRSPPLSVGHPQGLGPLKTQLSMEKAFKTEPLQLPSQKTTTTKTIIPKHLRLSQNLKKASKIVLKGNFLTRLPIGKP